MVQKVAARSRHPCNDRKLTVNLAVNGYIFFGSGKDKATRDGLRLSSAVPKMLPLTPTAPTAIRLWETFTLTLFEQTGYPTYESTISAKIETNSMQGRPI